nr:MAG TPA: hypothetical protein [Caudoviricetes sp.]DAX79089.1 MAG TPA: hypothetical protein [Caudoviricetes sp.]
MAAESVRSFLLKNIFIEINDFAVSGQLQL